MGFYREVSWMTYIISSLIAATEAVTKDACQDNNGSIVTSCDVNHTINITNIFYGFKNRSQINNKTHNCTYIVDDCLLRYQQSEINTFRHQCQQQHVCTIKTQEPEHSNNSCDSKFPEFIRVEYNCILDKTKGKTWPDMKLVVGVGVGVSCMILVICITSCCYYQRGKKKTRGQQDVTISRDNEYNYVDIQTSQDAGTSPEEGAVFLEKKDNSFTLRFIKTVTMKRRFRDSYSHILKARRQGNIASPIYDSYCRLSIPHLENRVITPKNDNSRIVSNVSSGEDDVKTHISSTLRSHDFGDSELLQEIVEYFSYPETSWVTKSEAHCSGDHGDSSIVGKDNYDHLENSRTVDVVPFNKNDSDGYQHLAGIKRHVIRPLSDNYDHLNVTKADNSCMFQELNTYDHIKF